MKCESEHETLTIACGVAMNDSGRDHKNGSCLNAQLLNFVYSFQKLSRDYILYFMPQMDMNWAANLVMWL